MKQNIKFFGLIFCVALVSCTTAQTEGGKNQTPKTAEEVMIERNREQLRLERESIEKFIKQNDFVMQRTGSGLYYMDIKQAPLPVIDIKEEDYIEYAYRISLLDGTPIRNSEEDGTRQIIVGKDQVELGLHEAFLMMAIGQRTLFIFPSHLAHGFAGNTDNVSPGSTLIYELEPLKKLK